ncbi:MAG: flagellar biosynthesis protein FlhA [Deltaproteobacteria bacterium]|nr:flagellar biosynthesis protein FlhA [Deltaproteobacteria bacterium]
MGADTLLAAAFFWILAMMAVPLPPALLDLLLSVSFTVSLLVLLVALYTDRPLDFSVFPSLLLIVTLLRLGLNVASTRLILLHGAEGPEAAGHLIQAFGAFAVGGSFLVGFALFAIFLVINFVVITKGAGRIAEVAARFTLDALPGKQMAVDADLNHGVIDDQTARRRRVELQRETDFYGAMDGASKFVRGDAIAGLVILVVNVVGGLAIGVFQEGMPLVEAATTYTILTVGDGLVSQIPALVVSTAAGVVVSRAAGGAPLAEELRDQLVLQPRPLALAAGMLGTLALVPGLPFLPFATLAVGAGALAWRMRDRLGGAPESAPPPSPAAAAIDPEAQVRAALGVDELELELGYQLVPLADPARGGELLGRIKALRRQLAGELGFVVPLVHVRDNVQLGADHYSVLLRGNPVAAGQLPAGRWLALQPGPDAPPVPGDPTRDPAFGLPARWVRARDRERAAAAGWAVVDPATALATHLAEVIRGQAAELLTRRHVRELLDRLAEQAPKLVDEIVPAIVPLSTLHRTLRQLLAERVSIRDLETILETLAEHVPRVQDVDQLTELVRQRLARTIARPHLDGDGVLRVWTLEPGLDERLRGAVQRTDQGAFFSLDAPTLERLVRGLEAALTRAGGRERPLVLLAAPALRGPLRQLVARLDARTAVLSHNELPPELRVAGEGVVELSDAH